MPALSQVWFNRELEIWRGWCSGFGVLILRKTSPVRLRFPLDLKMFACGCSSLAVFTGEFEVMGEAVVDNIHAHLVGLVGLVLGQARGADLPGIV